MIWTHWRFDLPSRSAFIHLFNSLGFQRFTQTQDIVGSLYSIPGECLDRSCTFSAKDNATNE